MDKTNMHSIVKRSVKVYYDCDNLKERDFVSILLGIEEEGIPYEVQGVHESNVLELAYNASLDSRLGVGVGVSKEGVVLQYEKLKKDAPLFRIKLYQTDMFWNIGANAARLVKRVPFRPID